MAINITKKTSEENAIATKGNMVNSLITYHNKIDSLLQNYDLSLDKEYKDTLKGVSTAKFIRTKIHRNTNNVIVNDVVENIKEDPNEYLLTEEQIRNLLDNSLAKICTDLKCIQTLNLEVNNLNPNVTAYFDSEETIEFNYHADSAYTVKYKIEKKDNKNPNNFEGIANKGQGSFTSTNLNTLKNFSDDKGDDFVVNIQAALFYNGEIVKTSSIEEYKCITTKYYLFKVPSATNIRDNNNDFTLNTTYKDTKNSGYFIFMEQPNIEIKVKAKTEEEATTIARKAFSNYGHDNTPIDKQMAHITLNGWTTIGKRPGHLTITYDNTSYNIHFNFALHSANHKPTNHPNIIYIKGKIFEYRSGWVNMFVSKYDVVTSTKALLITK